MDEYIEERREKQDLFWPLVKPLPGVIKLVEHLKSHKIPMAVATGSIRRNFELKSAHLQDLFGAFGKNIICGDDPTISKGKPAPDIFLVAAKALEKQVGEGDVDLVEAIVQRERSHGLVFEDATNGVQAAKRAGMKGARDLPTPGLKG